MWLFSTNLRLVYYWSHITMVPEASYHIQKFGIAELRYFSEKRKPNYCLHARKFCPIFN